MTLSHRSIHCDNLRGLSPEEDNETNTVTWTANGGQVILRPDGSEFIITRGGDTAGARNLDQALGMVSERVNSLLWGSHGMSGWSVTCEFAGVPPLLR